MSDQVVGFARQAAARARWAEPESPFCACCLLVNLNDGAVDKLVFKLGVTAHGIGKRLE